MLTKIDTESYMSIPHCEVIPLPDHQASFRIAGQERLRWHFGPTYPRPFFYPLLGPSGTPLTRMGHPGAPDHDHHQSIWFAHNKVLGIDFWGNRGAPRIRQQQWMAYQDGEEKAIFAAQLGWYDGHEPKELLVQELIAIVRPADESETLLEIQATFRPTSATLEFGQTNFGFFAVRVAKSISAHFGGGQLTNSEGATGEPAIFGRPARWMDYSGPVLSVRDGTSTEVVEGITYFDHSTNPHHPAHWHVREDGWMCASPCMKEPLTTSQQQPLKLRYLLHAHGGALNEQRAETIAQEFNARPGYAVRKSAKKHTTNEVVAAG